MTKYAHTLSKKDMSRLADMLDDYIAKTEDTVNVNKLWVAILRHNDYVKAYNYYADAWDGIADEDKNIIHEKMQRLNI